MFVSLSLFLVGCGTFLAGCGAKKEPSCKVAGSRILIWHWMTDRQEAFQALAKRYEEQTGIKVEFALYAPSGAYSDKVRSATQAGSLPDIFGVLGEKRDFAAFIEAGHVENLTPYIEKKGQPWKKAIFPEALMVNEFEPANEFGVPTGIYGIPLDMTSIQMIYSKKLLRDAGLDPENPPQTWEEFLEALRKLSAKGIKGLVSGWGELWMIDCFANNYAFNIMGEDKVMATYRGEVAYTDPDWIRVFGLFKDLTDAGGLASGIVTMNNKYAEQTFANGRATFAFNGSWCVNVYMGMNPALEYGVILPPPASDKYPMRIWGGAGSSLVVNAHSPCKEEAIKFLFWLTEKPQQDFLAQKTLNLPANQESVSSIPVTLAAFADDIANSTHPNIWPAHEFPLVVETFDKGIQSIIIKEKTPQQVAEEVQAIKDKELRRKAQK